MILAYIYDDVVKFHKKTWRFFDRKGLYALYPALLNVGTD